MDIGKFPSGINNIIIQYCFYPICFQDELIEQFRFTIWSINEHWFYDTVFVNINKLKCNGSYKLYFSPFDGYMGIMQK